MRKSKLFSSAFAVCLVAGAALAAQDPPPPANQSEAAIVAWAKAARVVDDTTNPQANWTIMGALDEGLLMGAVQQRPGAPGGVAKVGIRLERFRPNGQVRSEASLFDLDCGKQTIKATLDAGYAEHNLAGARQDRPFSADWAPVASNELVAALKDEACRPGATVNIKDPAAVRAWINANSIRDRDVGVKSGQWSMLGATDAGLIYSILDRRDDQSRTAYMVVRTERFAAEPNARITASLSQTEEFEINCRNNRVRSVGVMRYASHNLLGATDGERKIAEWSPVAQHPVLAKSGTDLCREFQVRRDFQTQARDNDDEED